MTSAGTPPTESFFYFCAINSNDRKLWLQRMIVENEVYFRNRAQLNDPNELRPSVVFNGTDKQIRKFVRQLVINHFPTHLSPAKRLLEENKLIYRYRNTPQSFEETLHQILDGIGLFCLSERPTDPLLWAHYADGHRGICVEFSAHVGLFGVAQRIAYTDEAPVINRLADSPSEILEKSMLTKGCVWSYEREWRVIARPSDEARMAQYFAQHDVPTTLEPFMRNQHGPGYYSFPAGAIRSVILGSSITPQDEAWLESVVDQAGRPIRIRRASLGRDGVVTVA